MNDTSKPILPTYVVQEENDTRKVHVYLDIPELRVKRCFPNLLKFAPSNGEEKTVEFRNQSFTYSIHVQHKTYSISIAKLPGEIQPERCSIKYQRGGCWLTLVKSERTSWMNRICDDFNPGLDIQEDDFQTPPTSADVQQVQLKDTNMPPPFNLVPLAPCPPSQQSTKTASSK